jgi:hypothetical protein
MKHRRHFGIANGVGPIGVARIDALVSDLDRRIQVLDCDIAAEEEHALVFNHAGHPIVARTLAARRDIRPPSPRSRSDLSAFRNGPTNFRPSGIGPCCRPGATRANSFSPIPMAGCVSPDHLSAPSATDVVFLTSALCQRTHASHARTRYRVSRKITANGGDAGRQHDPTESNGASRLDRNGGDGPSSRRRRNHGPIVGARAAPHIAAPVSDRSAMQTAGAVTVTAMTATWSTTAAKVMAAKPVTSANAPGVILALASSARCREVTWRSRATAGVASMAATIRVADRSLSLVIQLFHLI